MPVLVKACRTGSTDGPTDGESVNRWTVSPGRRFVRQQLTRGSFDRFPLRLNLTIRHFDPRSSNFSHFKPRNITKTYLSQISKSKLRELDATKEKRSRTLV